MGLVCLMRKGSGVLMYYSQVIVGWNQADLKVPVSIRLMNSVTAGERILTIMF